ncbi:sporulation membrane protein YtrI [Niallia nealsonii]|uniref:Sporulation protein n=1 Tax=Niallia nealsonii TaxID=115979 RepID=A0A2N0Z645_9BACI|nr:sporulation membrane protein YtrI [Niallia nealsonii]PKG24991.1 sporulation protein [Niallia nealsonii]
MRVPPFYRSASVQRFFAGMVIGGVIAWCIFLFMFGVSQERYSKEIKTQKETINELKAEKEIWQKEFSNLNKKTEKKLTIQDLVVKINNKDQKKYDINSVSVHEMQNTIKEDLSSIIAKDMELVFKSKDLLRKSIENKVFVSDGKRYKFKVTELFIYTTIYIEISVAYAD